MNLINIIDQEYCTCCLTGHRDISSDELSYVQEKITEQVLQAIEDGYTHFISGFAGGSDLIFAEIVLKLKKENRHLSLEAAIPQKGWLQKKNQKFQTLLAGCDCVNVLCEKYIPDCFFIRDRYMVDYSSRVLAVYDGRQKGGTFYTIQYARKREKEVRIIPK